MGKLFGTSGIRGIYSQEITDELARHLGNTLGRSKKNILIGHDQRESSPSLMASFVRGATAAGADITLAGLACSPTCAFAARHFNAAVTVTASHNPPEYNGFKFWNPDGSGFSGKQEEEIEREVGKFSGSGGGKVFEKSFAQDHINGILRHVGKSSLKVVVDCNHGTTGTVTPKVLESMGCEVIVMNGDPHPDFAPLPYNDRRIGDWGSVAGIGELIATVKKSGADLGLVHDGDGDRLFSVLKGGRLVTGDELLALFVAQTEGDIVTAIDGSMIVDKFASGKVYKVPVGDVFVSNGVKEHQAVFGGEACSGTFIFPSHCYAPDGPLAAAKLVELASKTNLEAFLEKLPSYIMDRESVPCPHGMKHLVMRKAEEEAEKVGAVKVVKLDGVRCEFKDGWFLIRPSGTSPNIRVTVEAADEKSFKSIRGMAMKIVKG